MDITAQRNTSFGFATRKKQLKLHEMPRKWIIQWKHSSCQAYWSLTGGFTNSILTQRRNQSGFWFGRTGRFHCTNNILALYALRIMQECDYVILRWTVGLPDKTREYSKSAIFVLYENGRGRLLHAQSINTERASLKFRSVMTENKPLMDCINGDRGCVAITVLGHKTRTPHFISS